ncbi:MAG: hypothetical protein M3409_09875, partial [Gemmatimonadota bacterium]|nr:hypothetical protein [Gemmatimonadota bacterium]
LMRYLRDADPAHFQPMNANWGVVEPLAEHIRDKQRKRQRLLERARQDFAVWMAEHAVEPVDTPALA